MSMNLKQILVAVGVGALGGALGSPVVLPTGDTTRLEAANAMLKTYEDELAKAKDKALKETARANTNFDAFQQASAVVKSCDAQLGKALDTAMSAEKKAAQLKAKVKYVPVPTPSTTVSDDLERILDGLRSGGSGDSAAGGPDKPTGQPVSAPAGTGGPALPPEANPAPEAP